MVIKANVVITEWNEIIVEPTSWTNADSYNRVRFGGQDAEKLFNIFRDAVNKANKKEAE